MLAGSAALRLPDVYDIEHDDPADPCPGCMHATLEGGVCSVCGCELCERCGRVEVTGVSACCEACAPVYTVCVATIDMYATRSLRRAWEAQAYLGEVFDNCGAHIANHANSDLQSDGITDREQALLESWDTWVTTDIGRRVAPPHLCLQQSALIEVLGG